MKNMRIATVTSEAVPAITRLAQQLGPSTDHEKNGREGFLNPYTEAEYRSFLRRAEYFHAVLDGEFVLGFVLAHASERIEEFGFGGEVYFRMRDLATRPFTVIRQVAVDPKARNQRWGLRLYDIVAKLSYDDRAVRDMWAFIWQNPRNAASEGFHSALGWQEVETYALRSDNRVAGIWRYTIPTGDRGA